MFILTSLMSRDPTLILECKLHYAPMVYIGLFSNYTKNVNICIYMYFILYFYCTGSRFDIWYIGHIRCLNTDLQVGACEWYFHAEELSQVWGKKVTDMAFRLTDYGQKLNLTREETAALRAVSLTFPGTIHTQF